MTEQEKREKVIEEMIVILEKQYLTDCKACLSEEQDCFHCCAKKLYDFVLKREEEVRKETAKEIFKALDEVIAKSEKVEDVLLYGKNFSKTGILRRRFYVYKKDIRTLKEKFGVEVEE